MMLFCPTCANMLLYELADLEHAARFFCPTCPYICEIPDGAKVKTSAELNKKPIDPIFNKNDRRNMNETSSVPCPDCGHEKVSFTPVQTRSAADPMTELYTCLKCSHTWKEK